VNRKRLIALVVTASLGFAVWWPLQQALHEEEAWDASAYQPIISTVAALLGFIFGRGERLRFAFPLGFVLAASQVVAAATFSKDDEGANFIGLAIVSASRCLG
jgi:hypothetical protein